MKRDPKRIKKTLNIIEAFWLAYPGLRLGQLIGNVCRDFDDLYNVEEDELVRRLDALWVTFGRGKEGK